MVLPDASARARLQLARAKLRLFKQGVEIATTRRDLKRDRLSRRSFFFASEKGYGDWIRYRSVNRPRCTFWREKIDGGRIASAFRIPQTNGALGLREVRAGRAVQKRKDSQYGADFRLSDLRWEIAKCARYGQMHDNCQARYVDLLPR